MRRLNRNEILLCGLLYGILSVAIAPIVMAGGDIVDVQNNATQQTIVVTQSATSGIIANITPQSTPGKFRTGPTVRIRPLNDVINKSVDGMIEIYLENPNINDIPLTVDARISVPSGIHVYGQGFALANAAGMAYAILSVPPGSVRTVYVNIKAEKTGNYYTQFSGTYYPGDNKDAYQPISLTYPFTVYESSPDPKSEKLTNPEQIPMSNDWTDKVIPGIIIALVAGLIGLVYKIYEIRYAHRLQTDSKTTKTRKIEGTVTENETTETKTEEKK